MVARILSIYRNKIGPTVTNCTNNSNKLDQFHTSNTVRVERKHLFASIAIPNPNPFPNPNPYIH